MRRSIARLAAMLALFVGAACGVSVQDPGLGPVGGREWSAIVVQPVQPVFTVTPSQPIIVIIEFVPVNGFFLTPPVFFNSFTLVNPNLSTFCPNILTVGTPLIGSPSFGFPIVQFPIAPIGFGTCQIPLDLGMNGIVTLNVQVAGSSGTAASRRYVVRITPMHGRRTQGSAPQLTYR